MLRLLLFAMPIDAYTCQARHGSGKNIYNQFPRVLLAWRIQNNVKKMRNFLRRFPKIYMYISTVVAAVFPPLSMTEVIGICNFVQTAGDRRYKTQVPGPRSVKTPDVQRVATTAATIPCNTPLPHSMLTKVKHFGVRNNIEKGRGSSLAQTVSRFVAGIV